MLYVHLSPNLQEFPWRYSISCTILLHLILALVIILSPIIGIIYTTVFAGAIFLTGKLFSGVASFKDIFKTISLINIPAMVLIPFYLIWLLSNPDSFFIPDSEPFNLIGLLAVFVSFVVAIWSAVILIAGVAEAG